jgi:UDP-N-acetylmuramoylalanine--D-glutamate ligase
MVQGFNNLDNKNISILILGFGITGQSFLRYFKDRGYKNIVITDVNILDANWLQYLNDNNIHYFQYIDNKDLLNIMFQYDIIAVSPGIDIKAILKDDYHRIDNKILSELDIFKNEYNNRTILVTGSVGKTSTTEMIHYILNLLGYNIDLAGNIGIPMLDILDNNIYYNTNRYALLEVSSFQLEFVQNCLNDIAIITNIYNNHLDRHQLFDIYKSIKLKIVFQNKGLSIVPATLFNDISDIIDYQNIAFVSASNIDINDLNRFKNLYYINNGIIFRYKYLKNEELLKVNDLSIISKVSFIENWLIIIALLDYLNVDLSILQSIDDIPISDHRLKFIKRFNNIDFYDDSKSTVIESTISAVLALINRYDNANIILLVGGISKGYSRGSLFNVLKNYSKHILRIIAFGKEADTLKYFAFSNGFDALSYTDLDSAFNKALDIAKSYSHINVQILLSPSGASFDLFKDYKARGIHFKNLVSSIL